jgi:hypothetical protein
MAAKAKTVREYLDSLPEDRRQAIEAIRKVINAEIDPDFEEGIQYGMLAWYLPHSKYPAGYHCDPKEPLPFASIASQKRHIGLYLFCIYTNEKVQSDFVKSWKASGQRLDMGKSCVRVRSLEETPLDVVAELFRNVSAKDFVASYEAAIGDHAKRRASKGGASKRKASKKKSTKKKSAKKKASKKSAAKKKSAKKRTTKN